MSHLVFLIFKPYYKNLLNSRCNDTIMILFLYLISDICGFVIIDIQFINNTLTQTAEKTLRKLCSKKYKIKSLHEICTLHNKKFQHERPVRNITDGFNGTEVKADPVPKKDDAKEDKENGRNVLPTTPTTTVVSTLYTSFKEHCKAFSVCRCLQITSFHTL